VSLSGKLPLAVRRLERAGVLAALAHVALELVPRLSLRAARRQSRVAGAHLRQSRRGLLSLRLVARRELELRGMGTVAWAFSGHRANRRKPQSAISDQQSAIRDSVLAHLAASLHDAGRDGRLGLLSRRHARR